MEIKAVKPIKKRWHFRPDLNDRLPPYYSWPPNMIAITRRLITAWAFNDVRIYVLTLSFITWYFFPPSLERCIEFSFYWIAQIWIRYILVIGLVAGGLHLYFYTYRQQASVEKYEQRGLADKSKTFHFNNQTLDNMFWVLVGTVGFLTFYEAVMMWAYANHVSPQISFRANPYWFVFLLLIIPGWTGFHFYWQHRAFHIPCLYRLGHDWHHKNVNVGPWSGAAVHPLENLVWFSAVLILLLIPSHPIHALFLLHLQVITAITTHVGFDSLIVGGNRKLKLGDFYHQLHHRFYDCNYGTIVSPWDRWFGTYHDGTPAGDAKIRTRRGAAAGQDLIEKNLG